MKDEDPFDFVRPKKYAKNVKNPLRRPGRPAMHKHVVNQADIKQYDFHSSGEEEYAPMVSASRISVISNPLYFLFYLFIF